MDLGKEGHANGHPGFGFILSLSRVSSLHKMGHGECWGASWHPQPAFAKGGCRDSARPRVKACHPGRTAGNMFFRSLTQSTLQHSVSFWQLSQPNYN